MVKHTPLLSGLLGLMTIGGQVQATIHYLNDDAWFSSMHKNMQTMHEHMIKSIEEMQHVFDALQETVPVADAKSAQKQALSLEDNDTQVIITLDIPEAQAENMKAERNLDSITIDVPQENGATLLRISAHMLSVEQKQNIKKDDGSTAKKQTYLERTLPHVVDMGGDISIEHTEEENRLHITLTRKHKKRSPQQLPIVRK